MLVLYVPMDLYVHVYFKETMLDTKEESGLREREKLMGTDHSKIVFGGNL